MKRLIILAPVLILAACGDSEPAPAGTSEQGGAASGEVLGGTISDAMIPLDQLTSVSPPAERTSTVGSGAGETSSEPQSSPEPESAEAVPAPAVPPPPAPAAPTVAPPLEQ